MNVSFRPLLRSVFVKSNLTCTYTITILINYFFFKALSLTHPRNVVMQHYLLFLLKAQLLTRPFGLVPMATTSLFNKQAHEM